MFTGYHAAILDHLLEKAIRKPLQLLNVLLRTRIEKRSQLQIALSRMRKEGRGYPLRFQYVLHVEEKLGQLLRLNR